MHYVVCYTVYTRLGLAVCIAFSHFITALFVNSPTAYMCDSEALVEQNAVHKTRILSNYPLNELIIIFY